VGVRRARFRPGPRRQARWGGIKLRCPRAAPGPSRAARCAALLRPEERPRNLRGTWAQWMQPPAWTRNSPGAVGCRPGLRLGGRTRQATARDDVHPHPCGSAGSDPFRPDRRPGGTSPRTPGPLCRAGETAGRRAARDRTRRPDLGKAAPGSACPLGEAVSFGRWLRTWLRTSRRVRAGDLGANQEWTADGREERRHCRLTATTSTRSGNSVRHVGTAAGALGVARNRRSGRSRSQAADTLRYDPWQS